MAVDLARGDFIAIGLIEATILHMGDHQDPFAARAFGGFDHKATAIFYLLGNAIDTVLLAYHAYQIRHGNIIGKRQLLGGELVVHPFVKLARIVAANIVDITLVHIQHASAA